MLSAPPPSAIGRLLHGRAQNCPGSVTPDPSPGCPSPASRRTPLSVSPADLPRLMPWAPSLMWEEQTPHPGVSFAPGGLGLGLMSPWPPGFLHPITASTSPLHLPGLDAVLCAPSQPLPPANLGPAPTCLCRPYPCEKTGSQGAQQDLREWPQNFPGEPHTQMQGAQDWGFSPSTRVMPMSAGTEGHGAEAEPGEHRTTEASEVPD